MNLKLLAATLPFFCANAFAQITITDKDMPSAGDSYTYSEAATQGLNFNANKTGANQSWDFSKLKPTVQGTANYVSSLNTPYLAYFLNTIGIKTQDTLNLLLIKLSNIHDFHKKTTAKWSVVGRGFSFSGLPLPANYVVEDKIYNFPLKYKDYDSTPFYFTLKDPTGTLPFRYAQTGWRVTKVDGWGKVTTPYGSFSCLRVKTKLITTDTIVIAGFAIPIPRTTYEYRWLTPGEKIPVLQINGNQTFNNFTPTLVKYRDVPRPLLPVSNFSSNGTNGPVSTEFNFTDLSTGNPTEWIWNVEPNHVKFMWGSNAGSRSPDIRFDSLGTYDVSLTTGNKGGLNTRIRKGYITIAEQNPNGLKSPLNGEYFILYPNPANENLTLELGKVDAKTSITIFSLDGKMLLQQNIQTTKTLIDLNSLPAGSYVISIENQNDKTNRIFQKQ